MGSGTANALIEELKRDAEKGELLLWASARGLTADVIELVQTGADPSAKDKSQRQAVHYAASNGHIEILEYLFTKGVLLDAEDDVGRGALHYAAAGGHAACVSFLLGKECWRDAPDAADDSPLHLAARVGSLPAIRALAEAGAKPALPNKRSLTPFAEAVLGGHLQAAEYLATHMEGGLEGALRAAYRGVPLLHLAAGLGRAAAVEWLLRQRQQQQQQQQQGQRWSAEELAVPAGEQRYTPLHAAALSGDPDTVTALLRLGADPLSQTLDGKLPLELVPRAAPPKAAPPPPGSSSSPSLPAAEDPEAATAAAATEDPQLVRSARRAFRALVRAAAEHGDVDLGGGSSKVKAGAAGDGKEMCAGKAVAKEEASGAASGAEEDGIDGGDYDDDDSPAAICLRQLSSMTFEQQVAKVESYARMDERKVQELSYLDMEAQAAVTVLRQAMGVVEVFGAVAALRADEDFQSDIRDPRVRDALADAKRTNDLSRYEELPAVMSVAAKFKRLHAVTRQAGGLQVVIDDLRSELPGNDPASTAAKAREMRATQRARAEAAVKAVLRSVAAAVPERVRNRISAAATASSRAAAAAAGGGAGEAFWKPRGSAGEGGEERRKSDWAAAAATNGGEESFQQGEDEEAFKARMAARERVDKLRAAATSAWTAGREEEAAVGYADRLERRFQEEADRAEGKRRWRLADFVGVEVAQSLSHTLRAALLTAAAFLVMWLLGLMPQQQTAALVARQEAAAAARRAQERLQRLSQLDGLGEGAGGGAGGGI